MVLAALSQSRLICRKMSHLSSLISVVLLLLQVSFGSSQGLNDDCKYIIIIIVAMIVSA